MSYVAHMTGVNYTSPTWDPEFKDSAWARIGPANLDRGGERAYGWMRQSSEVWPYFDRYDMARVRRHVVLLFGQLLGGPRAFDLSTIAQQMEDKHDPIRHSVNGNPITLRPFGLVGRMFEAAFLLMPEATDEDITGIKTTYWSLAPAIVKVRAGGLWVPYTPPAAA